MENTKNGNELGTLFKKDDVRKSVSHCGTHFVMDARKGLWAIRDDAKPVTDRSPETISQLDRNIVIVADSLGQFIWHVKALQEGNQGWRMKY